MKQDAWKQPYFSDNAPACSLRGHWASFCLVDEYGDGKAYGGLPYTFYDSAGREYSGRLDGEGFAKRDDFYCGPVVVKLDERYSGLEKAYTELMTRLAYKLPVTELQVRAEQTRFFRPDGQRVERSLTNTQAEHFYQVEVRDLVRHAAHLPPVASRTHQPPRHALKMIADLGFGPPQSPLVGVVLFPNRHTVLEVRPLRALRPMLSTEDQFCALNLYQLALMSTLSYCDFGQEPPAKPVDQVCFPRDPSVGHFFADRL
jgi:hypothetical protein